MKKYLLMIMAMIAMTFSFTSCGSDDDDNGSGTTTSDIVEEGNKLYFEINTTESGTTLQQTITCYFENGVCNKAQVVQKFPDASMAQVIYYQIYGEDSTEATLDGNRIIVSLDQDFVGMSKEDAKAALLIMKAELEK